MNFITNSCNSNQVIPAFTNQSQANPALENNVTSKEEVVALIGQDNYEETRNPCQNFVRHVINRGHFIPTDLITIKGWDFSLEGETSEDVKLPRNVKLEACQVIKGRVAFYQGELTASVADAVAVAAGPGAVAKASADKACAFANVRGSKAEASAEGAGAVAWVDGATAEANADGAIAMARRAAAVAQATVDGALACAIAHDSIAIANAAGARAVAKAGGAIAIASASGATAEADAFEARAEARANGALAIASEPGAVAEALIFGARAEASVFGARAIARAIGTIAVRDGGPRRTVLDARREGARQNPLYEGITNSNSTYLQSSENQIKAEYNKQGGLRNVFSDQEPNEEQIEEIIFIINMNLTALKSNDGMRVGKRSINLPQGRDNITFIEFDSAENIEWCLLKQGGNNYNFITSGTAKNLIESGNLHPISRERLTHTDFIRGQAVLDLFNLQANAFLSS